MTAMERSSRPFAWLPPTHPLTAELQCRWDHIAAPAADWRASIAEIAGRNTVEQHELTARRVENRWMLTRFASSLQSWPTHDGATSRGLGHRSLDFDATSFVWRATEGVTQRFRFPDEPYLESLAGYTATLDRAPAAQLLRYVPMRRFTVAVGAGRSRAVEKLKRRSRAAASHARARAVCEAVEAQRPAFAVPVLTDFDPALCTYGQVHVAGEDLAHAAAHLGLSAAATLGGSVHGAFHDLRAALPATSLDHGAAAVKALENADWIAAAFPEIADVVVDVAAWLQRWVPVARDATACHGDLAWSHVLLGEQGPTVIDLDLASAGDSVADVARSLVLVRRDVPPLLDEARTGATTTFDHVVASYVQAYAEARGQIDERALAWHRAVAELAELRICIDKDRPAEAVAPAVARTLGMLRAETLGVAA
jgi:Phosphotransferase enzyme family